MNKLPTAPTTLEIIDKIDEIIDDKQDTLVSGTNIKTINNESILGSGNITISGGGGTATDVQINGTSITSNNVANIVTNTAYDASSNKIATMSDIPENEIFIATYGTTFYSEITNAYEDGKAVFVKYVNGIYPLVGVNSNYVSFCGVSGTIVNYITCESSSVLGWSIASSYTAEKTSNKTTSLSPSSTNTQYPSAKATYDTIIANTPIGAIIPFTCSSSYTPNNCLPCDGTQYSKSQFNAFYTNFLANGNLETCSFADYTTELNTYGSCAKFALDTTNEVFRVPSIADGTVIQQAKSNAEIGKGYNAGLPNITGSMYVRANCDGFGRNEGAFTTNTLLGSSEKYPTFGSNNSAIRGAEFDASASNPIYGNSTTVQPQAVALKYFVVVANATINQTAMDWSSWATSLSGKANVDLSNVSSSITSIPPTSLKNFDGQWVILENVVEISLSTAVNTYSIDLNNYINFPDNNSIFEIYGNLTMNSSNDTRLALGYSNISTTQYLARVRSLSSSRTDSTCFTMPTYTDRTIYYQITNAAATASATLSICAYRRIGTNS